MGSLLLTIVFLLLFATACCDNTNIHEGSYSDEQQKATELRRKVLMSMRRLIRGSKQGEQSSTESQSSQSGRGRQLKASKAKKGGDKGSKKAKNSKKARSSKKAKKSKKGSDESALLRLDWSKEFDQCTPLQKKKRRGRDSLPLCVGIRGNGPRLYAHFGALARLVEDFGPIDGASGESSASITMTFVDAIQSSDLVVNCGGECCSYEEQNTRISFLLRSFESFTTTFLPILAEGGNQVLLELQTGLQEKNVKENLSSDDPVKNQQGLVDFLDILNKSCEDEGDDTKTNCLLFETFINPQIEEDLGNSMNPPGLADDILEGFEGLGLFQADTPTVFVRPGLINYDALSDLFGEVASFLHGDTPTDIDQMDDILTQCAFPGEIWADSINRPYIDSMSNEITCQEAWDTLFEKFVSERKPSDPSYADNLIGTSLPATIATGVMIDEARTEWEDLRELYLTSPTYPIDTSTFNPPYDDTRFGFFGDRKSLRMTERVVGIDSRKATFDDSKSSKYLSLGEATFKEAMMTSGAEPTLSRGVPIKFPASDDGKRVPTMGDKMEAGVSIGGWTEGFPTQVLLGMGCDRIVLINRRDGVGEFKRSVQRLVGATEDDLDDQYSLTDLDSSLSESLDLATGVLCTDWDGYDLTDGPGMAQEGYELAPFLHSDSCFAEVSGEPGSADRIVGCTAGVGPESSI